MGRVQVEFSVELGGLVENLIYEWEEGIGRLGQSSSFMIDSSKTA